MAQAFFTLHGKVVLERDKIFLRTLKALPMSETPLFKVILGVVALILFVSCFFIDDPSRRAINIVLSIFLLGRWVVPLVKIITKSSLANRIPLSHIGAYSLHPQPHGLETILTLHLQTGRTREITFRSREKEAEAFCQALQAHGIILKGEPGEGEFLPA